MSDQRTGTKLDKRDGAGRFVKGARANPGGRPKLTEEQKDIKKLLAHLVPKSIEVMEQILASDSSPRDKIKVAEMVLDRVYGKPQQYVDVDAHDTSVHVTWEKGTSDYGM